MNLNLNEFLINKSNPNSLGWRALQFEKKTGFIGEGSPAIFKVLLNLVHVSDTHICDAQSPARVEYLDRYADPHHGFSKHLSSLVGTYRAQESMTTQVLESMLQSINRIERTPFTQSKLDTVIFTGDVTDNAQENELAWFLAILSGGKVRPDSGNPEKWQGIGNLNYSPFYWNPHGTPKGEKTDFPRDLYGFPTVPELLNAVRAPFIGSGLKTDWLAVHGNHDALLQGTVPPQIDLRISAVGEEKIVEIPDESALAALSAVSEIGPVSYPTPENKQIIQVTSDASRNFLSDIGWNQTMNDDVTKIKQIDLKKKYWRKDFAEISILALDTVNSHGGWQGSIDVEQFDWLRNEILGITDKYVIISSHHPIQDMYNTYSKDGSVRISGSEIEQFLIQHANVIAWLCGHSHQHQMKYFGPNEENGFWQIETGSLIDWPQQARILEIFLDDNHQVWIASSPLDHAGSILLNPNQPNLDDINEIAGLSRLLSVNDWQRRGGTFAIEKNEGTPFDRNALVCLPKRIR